MCARSSRRALTHSCFAHRLEAQLIMCRSPISQAESEKDPAPAPPPKTIWQVSQQEVRVNMRGRPHYGVKPYWISEGPNEPERVS